jgi:hypothetical protein
MSNQAMTQMLEKAMADEGFAQGLVAAVGEKQGDAAIDAVAEYGKANGFAVTAQDATEMQRQLMATAVTPEGDLDDADLDNVAGGVGVLSPFGSGFGSGGGLNNALSNWHIGGGVRPQPAGPSVGQAIDQGLRSVENFIRQW